MISEQIKRIMDTRNNIAKCICNFFGTWGGGNTINDIGYLLETHCGKFNPQIKHKSGDGIYMIFEFHKDECPIFDQNIGFVRQNVESKRRMYPYVTKLNGKDTYIHPIHVILGNLEICYYIISGCLDGTEIEYGMYGTLNMEFYWETLCNGMDDIKLYPMFYMYENIWNEYTESKSCDFPYDVSTDIEAKTMSIALTVYNGEGENDGDIAFDGGDLNAEYISNQGMGRKNETWCRRFYKLVF